MQAGVGPGFPVALLVVGQMLGPTSVRPTGVLDVWGVRLQPWAVRQVLGVQGRELAGDGERELACRYRVPQPAAQQLDELVRGGKGVRAGLNPGTGLCVPRTPSPSLSSTFPEGDLDITPRREPA